MIMIIERRETGLNSPILLSDNERVTHSPHSLHHQLWILEEEEESTTQKPFRFDHSFNALVVV